MRSCPSVCSTSNETRTAPGEYFLSNSAFAFVPVSTCEKRCTVRCPALLLELSNVAGASDAVEGADDISGFGAKVNWALSSRGRFNKSSGTTGLGEVAPAAVVGVGGVYSSLGEASFGGACSLSAACVLTSPKRWLNVSLSARATSGAGILVALPASLGASRFFGAEFGSGATTGSFAVKKRVFAGSGW